ncbi:uncharacterized protein BDR25DRAFT_65262 [Lindgomyces ingoldianus]|uniref:Uncharacterized protein n=1 Tax=Lindgomyces ingoldianus TaxID=673940 RepID=A0ACB6RDD6_9PLEO|nr:uncharacterized protein BDR25DRAFT_65262 [Lindgomyces ingoldianus]KAF2476330.1 hypothetical protein BDR25DRAFT_65262 [Lindgomyces ingoldianus]
MLPVEIITLIILATTTAAFPQPQKPNPVNITTPVITSIPQETLPGFIHGESTVTGFEEDPTITEEAPGVGDPNKVHGESSVDGFETTEDIQPTGGRVRGTPESTPAVTPTDFQSGIFITETPTIIFIHTEIEASITQLDPGNEPQPTSIGAKGGVTDPANENSGNSRSNNPTVPASAQPTSGGEALLTEIISKIGAPAPGAQPSTNPPSSTENPAPNGNQQSIPGLENTEQPATPGVLVTAPGGQPTAPALTVDQSITLGAQTLTLTPGLSTTVGTGSAATFVALTTNSVGQTIIVVSSSGTAVSATVTNAPVTVSGVKTGFDASLTASASHGAHSTPSSLGGAAATTSRKGSAAGRWRWEAEWWISLVIGVLGIVVIL